MQNVIEIFNKRTWLVLFIAVLSVSYASIFVKWAVAAPAIIIAFFRMFWTTVLFGGISAKKKYLNTQGVSKRQLWLILLAGALLALHFISWISALKYTSVAHALTLSSTGPVFALLLSPLILGEKIRISAIWAVLISLIGVVLIAIQDTDGEAAFTGDILALLAALFVTLYLLIGRLQKESIPLTQYLTFVYATAAALLLLIGIAVGYPLLDYPLETHFWMLMLALVPTGIGHSLFNLAARRVPVYKVNLAFLGEPLIASVLAYFFFDEIPAAGFYPGAILIIIAIFLALRDEKG